MAEEGEGIEPSSTFAAAGAGAMDETHPLLSPRDNDNDDGARGSGGIGGDAAAADDDKKDGDDTRTDTTNDKSDRDNDEEKNRHRKRRRTKIRWKNILCRSVIILITVGGCLFVLWDLLYVPHISPRIGGGDGGDGDGARGGTGGDGEGDEGGNDEEQSKLLLWRDSQLLTWTRSHPFSGAVALICLLILSAVIFFPLSLLILPASFVYAETFGFWAGWAFSSVVCFLGACLGAMVSFMRSRYMTRDLVKKFSGRYPIVKALDKAFKTKGTRILFLLRFSPLIPYNALNYVSGITGVKFANFAVSLLGLMPGIAFSCFLGATGAEAVKEAYIQGEHRWRIIVAMSCGIAVGLLGMVGMGVYAKRELAKILAEEKKSGECSTRTSATMSTALDDELLEKEGQQHGLGSLRGWDVARDMALPPPPPEDGDGEDKEWCWLYV